MRASGPAASRTAATRCSSRSGASPTLILNTVTDSARKARVFRASASGVSHPKATTSVSPSRERPPMRSQSGRPSALPWRSHSAISRPARAAWLPTVNSSRSQMRRIASSWKGSRPTTDGPRYSPITSWTVHSVSPVNSYAGHASPSPTRPSSVSTRTRSQGPAESADEAMTNGSA